jgi:hypothetical protein
MKTTVMIGLAAARDVPVAGSLFAPVYAATAAGQINRARVLGPDLSVPVSRR